MASMDMEVIQSTEYYVIFNVVNKAQLKTTKKVSRHTIFAFKIFYKKNYIDKNLYITLKIYLLKYCLGDDSC
jgi:uncharacterized protein (DUF486 family)